MLNVTAADTLAKQTELADAESRLDDLKFPANGHSGIGHSDAVAHAEAEIQPLRDTVAAMQAIVGGRVFRIPTHNVTILAEKLAKLNKRADKLGVEPVGFTEHDTFEVKTGGNEWMGGKAEYTLFTHVAVRGVTPKLAGWTFAATLEHDENGVIVRRLPGLDASVDLTAYRTADPSNCDQCHTRRRRTDTYVVLHEDGTLKQVGSTCLRDFLGGQSPERIAAWLTFLADLLDELDNEESEFYGGSAPKRENTEEYMAHVACRIRMEGWTSKGTAYNYGGYATADAARDNMDNQRRQVKDKLGVPQWVDPSAADYKVAREAIEYVRSLKEDDLVEEYVYNLFTSLKGESIAKRQFGIAASAIKFHGKAIETKLKAEKTAASEYIGEVGQKKFAVDVTITKVVEIEDRYSYNGGTKPLYVMQDATGNVVQWFASSYQDGMEQGAQGTIVGTIKAHDDGKGKYGDKNYGKSTQLTRCKFTPKEA